MQIALFHDRFTAAVRALERVSTALTQIETTSGDMPVRWLDALNGPGGAMSAVADAATLALAEGAKDQARADAILAAQFPGGPQSVAAMYAAFGALDAAGTGFNDAAGTLWSGQVARIRTSVVSPVTGATTAQFMPLSVFPAAVADPFRADARVAAFRAALIAAGA